MEWSEVRPVLEVTYRLLDEFDDGVSVDAICIEMARPEGDERVERALALLRETGFIGGRTIEQSPVPVTITHTEKGLREVAGWPAEAGAQRQVEEFLAVLDERIGDPSTPEPERGKLRGIRQAIAEAAPRLMASVLVEYAERLGLGGPPSGGR